MLRKYLLLFLFGLILTSCTESENGSLFFFDFGSKTTLTKANLFLIRETTEEGRIYRTYSITDGDYIEGSGISLSNYKNATYFLLINLASANGTELSTGKFYQEYDQYNTEGTTQSCFLFYISASNIYFESPYTNEDNSPVVVSGGLEHGQEITIKFSGTLFQYWYKENELINKSVKGTFSYAGKVQNVNL